MPVLARDTDRLPSLWIDATSITLPTKPVVAITTCKTGKTGVRKQAHKFMQSEK
jgi:hypothetical protein